ncbi:brix domain-containing protein [Ditylenchus destructor]|uniref:Brix domain-containing protein n=1 Tax=Ditylenchus destructor TaxID=166010 RepID=A0AAD4R193_9BILA|nr:brix domain-containing protein [Ditylenchus destructor]
MIRREARLRREFIYRKSLEEKQAAIQERRDKVKNALQKNKAIPTDLRKDAVSMVKELSWGAQVDNIDDEYRWAGCEDPNIVITTSRNPSSRLKIFAKEMKLVIPNARRINRGGHDIKGIVNACKSSAVTDLVLLNETRGVPDSIIVSHFPHGPTAFFSLSNVVMRHDIPECGHMSEQYPHLIFHNINSKIGVRVQKILKHIFPVPKEDSKRVVTFANTEDFISFRQHTYKYGEGGEIELHEQGPRFELRPYCILLGTIDNADACDTEWVLRSFINKKKDILLTSE